MNEFFAAPRIYELLHSRTGCSPVRQFHILQVSSMDGRNRNSNIMLVTLVIAEWKRMPILNKLLPR